MQENIINVILFLPILILYFITLKPCMWTLHVNMYVFQPVRLFILSLVVKKLADFELPYVSLRSSEVENCKVGLRKW